MKIAVGCDHNAFELKKAVCAFLDEEEVAYRDFGVHSTEPVDYPDQARAVAEAVIGGECDRGILLCGTGAGMAVAANKVRGIRAVCCHDSYSAERARKSNNAQIMTMGAFVVGPGLATRLVKFWLPAEFQGGRSERKVNKIMQIEKDSMVGGS